MTFEEFEEAIFVEYEKTKHTDIVSFLIERSFNNHKKLVMMEEFDEPERCTRCGNGEAVDLFAESPLCEYCIEKDKAFYEKQGDDEGTYEED